MGTVAQGLDTWCLDSLQPGRYATGAELVAQRCYRRLITPAGSLRGGEDEANFGLDLAGYVGSTDSATVQAALPAMVRNELLKDPAVDDVTCDAVMLSSAGQTSFALQIAISTTAGDVTLIANVSAVSVDFLGVR